MMKLILAGLVFSLSTASFATGFTKWQMKCAHSVSPKDNPSWELHRFSMSPPGGPVSEGLSITKTSANGNFSRAGLDMKSDGETSPLFHHGTTAWLHWVKNGEGKITGYIQVYASTSGTSLLDIHVHGLRADVNTEGPLTDTPCRLVKP